MENQRPYIPRVAGAPPPPPKPEPLQTPRLAEPTGSAFRGLAHYCWLSVLVVIGGALVLAVMKSPHGEEVAPATSIAHWLLRISGVLAGVIALFGSRHGRRGILVPALVGLSLWTIVTALTIFSFPTVGNIQKFVAGKKAGETTASTNSTVPAPSSSDSAPKPAATSLSQSPAVLPDGGTRVEDRDWGFSFSVLEGYTATADKSPDELHAYKRKLLTEPARILLVKKMGGDYSRHLAAAENFPAPQAGQTSESAVFDWRGRKVGGTRSVDTKRNPRYLVFNVVIPLRKQAILVTVGGSEQYEAVIQEALEQVLGSLEELNP